MLNLREVGVYSAALIGCEVARHLIAESGKELELPEGVPVDRALLNSVATELQKALRRKGLETPFSIAALADVMSDLALALLNRERNQPNLVLQAEETKKRLDGLRIEDALGKI